MSVLSPLRPARSSALIGVSRLLAGLVPGGPRINLDEHLDLWGPPPCSFGTSRHELLEQLERSGLRGRGGGWFPTAVKWRAVSSRRLRQPVVVANGAEGEPASTKDRLLLDRVPQLVLDGASLAATAVGATRLVVYVRPAQLVAVSAAVADRTHLGIDPIEPEVVAAADGFVAGEASAVVAHLNGGPGALPVSTDLRPVHERGVSGRPTLVQNVETLAHVALIARFGATWFRQLGTADSPGTVLATVSGTGRRPGVVEMPVGTTLRELTARFSVPPSSVRAVLLGGYGGAWLSARQVMDVPLSEERLRPIGATFGAGVVALLPTGACPLAETARIVRYMEDQTAGQCGPCVNGLPAMTEAMTNLAFDRSGMRGAHQRLIGLCELIDGRGACHHPDGVARLVRSTLRTFTSHLDLHQRRGPCSGAYRPGVLRVPVPDRRGPVARRHSA